MHFWSFVAVSLALVAQVVAQSPAVTVCSSVVVSTITSPAALCSPTPCAPCDNGNYIPSQISAESALFSSSTSKLFSVLNASPVATGALQNEIYNYGYKIYSVVIDVGPLTCLSTSDINALLTHLGNILDQLDQVMTQAGPGIRAALGDPYYEQNVAFIWLYYYRYRIEYSPYYMWLSQGCVNWDNVAALNNKIQAYKDSHESELRNAWPVAPSMGSPCEPILTYSSVASACPPPQCRPTASAEPNCASCQVPEASISSFRSNIAAATASISAAVAYATSVPFQQQTLNSLIYGIQSVGFEAYYNIPADNACLNSVQSHAFLSAMTDYTNTATWALEQAGYLENPSGGPLTFSNRLLSLLRALTYYYAAALQPRISNPSSCYDCNDIAAFNAASANLADRINNYYFLRYVGYYLPQPDSLTASCTTCPISSASSISSVESSSSLVSSEVSSAEPSSSVESSSDISSVEPSSDLSSSAEISSSLSSAESTEASSDLSSSSAESTGISSDLSSSATEVSSDLSSSATEVSSDLSSSATEVSSDLSSSAESTEASSDLSSAEPTGVSSDLSSTSSAVSTDASSDVSSASESSASPSEPSLGSSSATSASVEPTGESSSISSADPSGLVSSVSLSEPSAEPSVLPTAIPSTAPPSFVSSGSSSGYFNTSSTASSSDASDPTSSTSTKPTDSTTTTTSTRGTPDTTSSTPPSDGTSSTGITLPCGTCPGGSTVLEGVSSPLGTTGTAPGTTTYTTTTVITKACPVCPGGSTTFTSTALVTPPAKSDATFPHPFTQGILTFTRPVVVTESCAHCPDGVTIFTTLCIEPSNKSAAPPAIINPTAAPTATNHPQWPPVPAPPIATILGTASKPYTVPSVVAPHNLSGGSSATSTSVLRVEGTSSVVIVPSESIHTSVIAANKANKETWASFALILVPVLFGL